MFERFRAISAGVLAIAILAAGCGGGSGDNSGDGSSNGGGSGSGGGGATTVTTSSISKAEFIKQATEICHREREDFITRLATYVQSHPNKGKSSSEFFADSMRAVLLPTIEKELAEIRELGAPAGDEAQIEAFLEAEQQGVNVAKKQKSIKGRFDLERHFVQGAKIAKAYGFPDCGNNSQVAQ